MKQLLLVIVAPWPHLTFCWNPAAFFEHVPSPSFSQVHLQVTENHRLTGAVQLQGRCSKGARDLQRTKLWTLQSSQIQNQTSIRDQDISRHIKTYQNLKWLTPAAAIRECRVALYIVPKIVAAVDNSATATKGAHMMRLAIDADMPALVNGPETAVNGICRVPSWRIKPKGLLLGRLRLLRLLRLLWLLSSASAWVCRWTTLGIAILQLAATNASEAIAEETCLVNIAELIILPSLQRDQAAQTAMSGIGNFGPPFLHSSCWLSGISITWHFFVWPWGVWQPARIRQLNQLSQPRNSRGRRGRRGILFRRASQMTSSVLCTTRQGQGQQHQALSAARHGDTLRWMAQAQRTEQQITWADRRGKPSDGDGHGACNPSNLVFTAISLTAPQPSETGRPVLQNFLCKTNRCQPKKCHNQPLKAYQNETAAACNCSTMATPDFLLKPGCFFRTCSFFILLPGSPSGDRKPPTNRCCTAARSVLKRRKRLAKD